jgi:uncharacterized membrane protein
MEYVGLLVVLVLVLLLGAVFGWIAFFRTLMLSGRIATLRAELDRAKAAAAPVPPVTRTAAPVPPPLPPPPRGEQPAAAPAPEPGVMSAQPPPPPVEPPRPQAASQGTAPRLFRDLEASLAGNWLVWVAGVALALGGVFIVAFAVEQGWLGPRTRVLAGAAAGLGMIAASEWLRRNGFAQLGEIAGTRVQSAAPAVTAGAGLVAVYGAVYAAFGLYQLIDGPVAFALLAGVAVGAAALALLHGPALVALGLVGAFVAPLLIGSDEPSAPALFTYVLAVAAAGLAITRLVGRRWPAFVALAGGALWPLLWLVALYRDEQAWALALYLPALLAAAVAFAWDLAREPPWLVPSKAVIVEAPVSIVAATLAGLVVFVLEILLAEASGHDELAILSLGAASVVALAAAWRREGFFALPAIAAGGVALVLYVWPGSIAAAIEGAGIVRDVGEGTPAPEGPPFLSACFSFALLFGLGGLFAQDRLTLKGPMATVTAAAPSAILALAFWRMTDTGGPWFSGAFVEQDWRWAAAAAALAFAYAFLLERRVRADGGPEAAPGPVAAYALGTCAAAAMAVGMALEQLWMSVGFAVLAPVAALLHRRLKIGLLAWAAVGFGVLATARLTVFGEVFRYDIGDTPIFNWLLWGYGVPIAALWATGRIFLADGLPREGRVVQATEAKALILTVALVSMEIRHLLNGGDLAGDYLDRQGLLETGLLSSTWLAGALLLRWRLGPKLYFVQRWAERLLLAAALVQIVLVQLIAINPWWGPQPSPVEEPPLANAMLLAYALPAVLAALYARVARGQGLARVGTLSGLVGAALAFAWVTLETRHLFHPVDLAWGAPSTDAERYAYSAVWLAFAGATLALGAIRQRPSMRYAALGLLVLVSLKVFFFDLAGLQGVLRGVSFLGLGGALMAIALLYQRLGGAFVRRVGD